MDRDIIFFDGEFTGLKSDGTDFLSVALVKASGEELYLEIEPKGEVNEWTQANVVPYLSGNTVSREEAKRKILDFVGTEKPYFFSYVPSFDWMGICGLFWVFEVPFHWIPLDFATMLFDRGIPPDTLPETLAVHYDIDLTRHVQHHALHDARLIRALYQKVVNVSSINS